MFDVLGATPFVIALHKSPSVEGGSDIVGMTRRNFNIDGSVESVGANGSVRGE